MVRSEIIAGLILVLFFGAVAFFLIVTQVRDNSILYFCQDEGYERYEKVNGHFNCCRTDTVLENNTYVENKSCVAGGKVQPLFRKFEGDNRNG